MIIHVSYQAPDTGITEAPRLARTILQFPRSKQKKAFHDPLKAPFPNRINIWRRATGATGQPIHTGENMTDYCITAVRRANKDDNRVSHVKLWEWAFNKEENKNMWHPLGAKSTSYVVKLLAEGHRVRSATKTETGIKAGADIEFVLRIAQNDDRVKIGEMPEF
ncbi:hypothetical protein [Xanthomonas campestris]|uniref:hypothetical protein n=1 Tax=Xanthomonas campestris TaxID=339 RepID=UPI0032E37278